MSDQNPYAPTAELAAEPAVSKGSGRREFLRRVARAQRQTIRATLLYLCVFPIDYGLAQLPGGTAWKSVVLGFFALGVVIFGAIAVFRLAELLRGRIVAMVYVLGLLIPFFGLLLLMLLSSQASSKLKRHGVRVGLLGADPDEI